MIKEKIKRDFLDNQSQVIVSNYPCKYFSTESTGFSLDLLICETELEQLIKIQKGIKEEYGINKSLAEIASNALKIALNETVKTCIEEGM